VSQNDIESAKLGVNPLGAAYADGVGELVIKPNPDDPRLTWMRKPFRPGALLDDLRAFVAATTA